MTSSRIFGAESRKTKRVRRTDHEKQTQRIFLDGSNPVDGASCHGDFLPAIKGLFLLDRINRNDRRGSKTGWELQVSRLCHQYIGGVVRGIYFHRIRQVGRAQGEMCPNRIQGNQPSNRPSNKKWRSPPYRRLRFLERKMKRPFSATSPDPLRSGFYFTVCLSVHIMIADGEEDGFFFGNIFEDNAITVIDREAMASHETPF